jgi:hypothetical protein
MSDQPKPRFEPPPWEQEAFERFRKEQDEARAREDLEDALREVRSPDVTRAASAVPPPATPDASEKQEPEAVASGILPEAQIDAMLIELRSEEPSAAPVSKGLMYGTIAFMTTAGLYIIIRSAVLFGGVRAEPGTSMLLATLLSFVVLLIGLSFLGGAFILFRKYRQHL